MVGPERFASERSSLALARTALRLSAARAAFGCEGFAPAAKRRVLATLDLLAPSQAAHAKTLSPTVSCTHVPNLDLDLDLILTRVERGSVKSRFVLGNRVTRAAGVHDLDRNVCDAKAIPSGSTSVDHPEYDTRRIA